MLFLWLKAFHLMAVVSWFAGLFYLPRLFVYHAMSEDQISRERFKVMERKLYRGIMTPAAIATLIFGLWMLHLNSALLAMGWIKAKLVLIVLLIIYHGFAGILCANLPPTTTHAAMFFLEYLTSCPCLP